ncbi:MAG: class I mannose-6-phosphate isomerase, partial [Ktedonobacteraceae bacterium]|nr:class I mannose-6-phosphate isomerase [Ktedonobacteraceae bacterium]
MVQYLYPMRLEASLHETIWGGRRLEQEHWKQIPPGKMLVGEAWETEVNNLIENGLYAGKTLGTVVQEMGASFVGERGIELYGQRFPLLAKFIDANAQLSVQVHPDDTYAAKHEGGKLGKTEFWYILAAEPHATIVHGFKEKASRAEVEQAIQHATLESLLHQEEVQAGDVIFVPAGTVHAIGSGILLYELQEYSDITYRMYDYGRLTASGQPRELHIERSLAVSSYDVSSRVKKTPVILEGGPGYEDRCLVACRYFVTREIHLNGRGGMEGKTVGSCIILSSLSAQIEVRYGENLKQCETLSQGQTMILPAGMGQYRIEGNGIVLYSYIPAPSDEAWRVWREK